MKDERNAQSRLDDIIDSATRNYISENLLIEAVRNSNRKMETTLEEERSFESEAFHQHIEKGRDGIRQLIFQKAAEAMHQYGIELLDVRIKRADLPPENERYVFERMKAERDRQAKKYRSEGKEEAWKVRAIAERERTIILAEASKKAEQIKGDGDARAIKIYAHAYEQDPEFYSFIRSLEAYKKSLEKGTFMVLSPEMEFFEYLKKSE